VQLGGAARDLCTAIVLSILLVAGGDSAASPSAVVSARGTSGPMAHTPEEAAEHLAVLGACPVELASRSDD
jgi:hypothetical protein